MNDNSYPQTTERYRLRRVAVLALAILQILVTLLPSMGIGEPIGERSDTVRTLITPAGWAFAIWGPLYAGSLAYSVYQLLPAQRRNVLLAKIGWPTAGAFLGNAVWAVYVQFGRLDFGSVIVIALTLLCLLACYRSFVAARGPFSTGERCLVVLPLSSLAAWLTAATIVNIAAALQFHGFELGIPGPTIGAAVVMIGGAIASAAIWNGRGNPWYTLVFLWALGGIFGATAGATEPVAFATIASAMLLVTIAIFRLAAEANRRWWFGRPAIGA